MPHPTSPPHFPLPTSQPLLRPSTSTPPTSRPLRCAHLALLIAAIACSGERSGPTAPTTPPPHDESTARIAALQVSELPAHDTVGHTVALRVRAVTSAGAPVPAQRLIVDVPVGRAGAIGDSATGPDGWATVRWTLDTAAGRQTLTLRADAVSTAVALTAVADVPNQLVAAAPIPTQRGTGATLAVQVAVADRHGNPVAGQHVRFVPHAGDGTIVELRASDTLGVARATWQLGPVARVQHLEASITGSDGRALSAPPFAVDAVPVTVALAAPGDQD